ncbi:transcription factor IIIC subunit delta N-term-domain-containing protein [Gautieria morchelliformis]|nr:transcription factor IIIC subunit delta N-term-domain-containing protein [Gautieria morchelliformis]
MVDVSVFTSLVVPVATNGPSQSTLQWSEDGQAFIVTRGAVYILMPNTGINFDPSSVKSASSIPSTNRRVKGEALSWYRNLIELEKTPTHHWPFDCQEWATVSLGSLDMSWVSITLSPTNLSEGLCCLMAALNTNLEVSLWAPSKNYLTGEWSKVQDVTQVIKDYGDMSAAAVQRTLNAQVRCISWSGQTDMGEGKGCIDGSLLALGNRAGRVIFMRLARVDVGQRLQIVASLDVADDWITHLAWRPWVETNPGSFRASLACGTADGGIVIVSVSVSWASDLPATGVYPRLDLKLLDNGRTCCPCDGSPVTALTWIDSKVQAPILAYAKPGVVYLQRMPSNLSLGWDGCRKLILQLQPVSSSSTPFAAVSGVLYYVHHDALMVSLFDGSFHMIHSVSTSPSLDTRHQGLRSEDLTGYVRTVFTLAEEKVSFADANRISGVFDYDGAGSIGWLHEKCCPDDLSYKHDAKHAGMFIVTQLWKDDNTILEQLASLLLHGTDLNVAPSCTLRGMFLHLREKTFLEAHQGRILDSLTQPKGWNDIASYSFLPSSSVVSLSKSDLRHAITAALFRKRDIRSCRLKLGVAMFCAQVQGIAPLFEHLVADLSTVLLSLHLRVVLRQLDGFANQLEGNARLFVHYWVMLCRLQDSSLLQQEAASLAARARLPADLSLDNGDLQEHCPACHTAIPLSIGGSAVCTKGHSWTRCSITSFILATPLVRTCIGCSRKALLPISQRPTSESDYFAWLPPAANSWIMEELLEAIISCTFCGNRYVRVL